MVKVKKELLSPCGLYCGVCRVHIAHRDNDIKFKEELLPIYKAYGAKSVEDIACTGCLSEGIIFPFCQSCVIKDCIKDKAIEGCRQCEEFPCEIIENWPSAPGKKIILRNIPVWRELGTEKWVDYMENRYKCPECGNQLFQGVMNCLKCNAKVNLD
ncbi:MAG: DUF3795 domain-containing protein [Promethearchaeota archaeon]